MLREGSVVVAKCAQCGQMFGITMERTGGVWHCVWAFKISEASANAEGYGDEVVSGTVTVDDEYPGCPYCGSLGWVSCGACKRLTCAGSQSNLFECEWCGNKGEVTESETFDLRGGGM